MKNYKFSFDILGLLLFLIIMVPNFIWFAVSAPNDVLRSESVTPIADTIGSFCQIFFVIAICVLRKKSVSKLHINPFIIIVLVSVILYFIAWIFYYTGMTNPLIILLLTAPPCCAFLFYAIDRKNTIALIPIVGFTVCHIIYAVTNYIV